MPTKMSDLVKIIMGLFLLLSACTQEKPDNMSTSETSSTATGLEEEEEHPAIQTVTGPETTSESDSETSSTSGESGSSTEQLTSEGPDAICGNGVREGVEECDDGNLEPYDDCTPACTAPRCGDGIVQKSNVEECDDGEASNLGQYGGCNPNCTVAAYCGDNVIDPNEVCDTGLNENEYNGCKPGCQELSDQRCGDGIIYSEYEHCEGLTDMENVPCEDCLFNFSQVTQMSCDKTCTWGDVPGCGKDDADIFCKLLTGKATAVASNWALIPPTDLGGFPCANQNVFIDLNGSDPRKWLGALPQFGVTINVGWQESMIKATHGNALVLSSSSVNCN